MEILGCVSDVSGWEQNRLLVESYIKVRSVVPFLKFRYIKAVWAYAVLNFEAKGKQKISFCQALDLTVISCRTSHQYRLSVNSNSFMSERNAAEGVGRA